MALKVKLANKAELDALAEPLRALYKDGGTGTYVLDADLEDVSGIKSALEKEREAKRLLETQLRETVDKYKDLDPEKAREALKALRNLEDKQDIQGLPEALQKQIDAIVEKRTERLREEHGNQVKAFETKLREAGDSHQTLEGRLSELLIDNALRAACLEAGIVESAVDDVILAGRQVYRIKDGHPVPLQGDAIIYGKDPAKPMPPNEWVAGQTAKKPHWFKGSSGSGAGNTDTGAAGAQTHKINAADAKDPVKYRTARDAAAKQGLQVEIVAA
jgi:hypothetical protein